MLLHVHKRLYLLLTSAELHRISEDCKKNADGRYYDRNRRSIVVIKNHTSSPNHTMGNRDLYPNVIFFRPKIEKIQL